MADDASTATREEFRSRDPNGPEFLTEENIYDEDSIQGDSGTTKEQVSDSAMREASQMVQSGEAGESNDNVVDNEHWPSQQTPAAVANRTTSQMGSHNHGGGSQFNVANNYGHLTVHFGNGGIAPDGNGYLVGSGQSAHRFLDLTERVATIDERERGILKAKYLLENGRNPVQTMMLTNRYSPYAVVFNRKVKVELRRLAHHFKFVDRCFAEYFRLVVPSFGREYVLELLADARNGIQKSMSPETETGDELERLYLGDLGQFCEAVSHTWDQPDSQTPKFTVRTQSDEEVWHYLQDAFEVPYWRFMLQLLARWQADANSPSGQIVNHFLNDVKKTFSAGQRRLNESLEKWGHDDKESILPILGGIEARINTLESLCPNTLSDIFDDDASLSTPAIPSQPKAETAEAADTNTIESSRSAMNKPTETAVLIAMVLIFLIAAIIPGYKAFSISMQTKGAGSIEDADFFYLIQASIMAVLGNLVMVVPLLGRYWFSPAYWLMWLFFVSGLIFALLSIILYPLCNTGWSSMVSFIGNICSASSVLVMTQANANKARKTKQD